MALPSYGQNAVQRRLSGMNQFSVPQQTGGPSPPPNFYPLPAGGQPGTPGYPTGDTGGQNPDRSRLYNQNYSGPMFNPYAEVGQRQNNNPYPTPYPGIQVSPTGAVTGAQPVMAQQAAYPIEAGMSANARAPSGGSGPTTQRTSSTRDKGTGQNTGSGPREQAPNNDRGGQQQNGGSGPREQAGNQQNGGKKGNNDSRISAFDAQAFLQGGRDFKGYSKDEMKKLGQDSMLSEALRQLVHQGNIAQGQYDVNTGNLRDTFRRQIQDVRDNKVDAFGDVYGGFAGSGLARSSAFGQSLGDVTQDFSRQAFDTRNTKTQGLTAEAQNMQNIMAALEAERTNQRQEALRRLALKQGEISGIFGG